MRKTYEISKAAVQVRLCKFFKQRPLWHKTHDNYNPHSNKVGKLCYFFFQNTHGLTLKGMETEDKMWLRANNNR